MSIKATNTPFAQAPIENGHGNALPALQLIPSLNPTQADVTVTTVQNVSITSGAKHCRIKNISGDRIYIAVKTGRVTGDATTTNYDFTMEADETYDLPLPIIDRDSLDFPTTVSMVTDGGTSTVHIRFF